MNKIIKYIKLMRIKHYLKNFLIFLPLIFSGQLWDINKVMASVLGLISFSLLASGIYCFNDVKDVENDREHPIKKNRPVASGKITKKNAIMFMVVLILLSMVITIYLSIKTNNILPIILQIAYIILNIIYSCGGKKVPILDVVILVSGFMIRLCYGAQITLIEVSNWLYLTIIAGAFYLGLGKRRNETRKQGDKAREVLRKYNREFLDKFMYVYLTLTIVFYSLWCVDGSTIARIGNRMIWTIPLILVIFMKYSLDIEEDSSYGDPVDVIVKDKILMALIMAFGLVVLGIIYM